MLNQLLSGGLVSLVNFGLHALMTGLIVVATHHIAAATDELHVFVRVASLMTITLVVLMSTHVIEIAVWMLGRSVPSMPLFVVEAAVVEALALVVTPQRSALRFGVLAGIQVGQRQTVVTDPPWAAVAVRLIRAL